MMGQLWNDLARWSAASLRRKITLILVASLTFASICFLALVILSYRDQILRERSAASTEVNRLLQLGLENAMLNRDIVGLRKMVERLGEQENISGVMILAPNGEVRFASNKIQLGRRFDLEAGELCPDCKATIKGHGPRSAFVADAVAGDILRSINPVRNRGPCTKCHGQIDTHPINGILVVDYDATNIRRDTMFAVLMLSGAGIAVVLTTIGGIGFLLNWFVLAPVKGLTEAADKMSLGQLGHRVPLKSSDEIGRLGRAFNDMSARIAQAVHNIETRERYLQDLIDIMPDGVRVIDMNYQVVKANRAFCEQQHRARSEVVQRPCYWSSHSRESPCPASLVSCPLHELQKGGQVLTCRHSHVSADEKEIPVEVSAALLEITIDDTQKKFVVEVIRDLSKDVRLSQEQRLSEIGFLAAGVAHEIHNPLASILLGFDSAKRALREGRDEKASKYLDIIEDQITRCIEVTSRLLKLSAPASEHRELVNLNNVVFEVLSLLNAEALKSEVDISMDLESELRSIGSDSEMRMMVLNIAQNALHAMPDGGRLLVSGSVCEDVVELVFEDTGVGIKKSDLAKIFDPFWSKRADGVHGTGLGLSICQEIVKRSGGRLDVTSVVGEGTRFVVTLPSAEVAKELS